MVMSDIFFVELYLVVMLYHDLSHTLTCHMSSKCHHNTNSNNNIFKLSTHACPDFICVRVSCQIFKYEETIELSPQMLE